MDSLNPQSYVRWYLPLRKLISSVSVVAQYRTDEIPKTIHAFRQIDYTDERLHTSGLLGDVIESHVWLIENSGRSLDSVFLELNISIDGIIANLSNNPASLNEITAFLFDLLEQRSLFTSSEYLAIELLEKHGTLLISQFYNQLEIYRAMSIGSTAADIVFPENTLGLGGENVQRMSDLESNYILVVFAAGWCPNCQQMVTELTGYYQGWQEQGVEVVLVSLDETQESFARFTLDAPFICTTDYHKWNSRMIQDYHVYELPAMYLLNNERKILLRPNSVSQLDSWVDWYLVQGNK